MKDTFPDGNFKVYGETRLNNKKEQLDEVELADKDRAFRPALELVL